MEPGTVWVYSWICATLKLFQWLRGLLPRLMNGKNLPKSLPVLRIFPECWRIALHMGSVLKGNPGAHRISMIIALFCKSCCVEFLTWDSGEASGLDYRKSLRFGGNVCIRIEHALNISFECIPYVSCYVEDPVDIIWLCFGFRVVDSWPFSSDELWDIMWV